MSRPPRILMVCTGNTCRSPLAAAMLASRLMNTPGLEAAVVGSAGTGAVAGTTAAEGSYLVAMERGLDLSHHRARAVTPDLLRTTDLVLAMTAGHRDQISGLETGCRVETLAGYADGTEADLPDPYGCDVAVYRDLAATLDRLLDRVVVRLRKEFA